MHRPRYRWLFIIPILAALVLSSACGGNPEDPLIRKFFQASRMGDNMTLANIATVSFDPSRDGMAQNVKVVSVTPEQTRVLQFKELEKARQEAGAAEAGTRALRASEAPRMIFLRMGMRIRLDGRPGAEVAAERCVVCGRRCRQRVCPDGQRAQAGAWIWKRPPASRRASV